MFYLVHHFTFYIHVIIGSLALVLFWIPLMLKKGQKRHLFYGRLFVNAMYIVAISGLVMSTLVLIDPIAVRYPLGNFDINDVDKIITKNRVFSSFLLMLSVLVFCNVTQSIRVLQVKSKRQLLKTPFHLGIIILLGVMSIFMAWVGLTNNILLFSIFAFVGMANSFGILHYIFKKTIKSREVRVLGFIPLFSHLGAANLFLKY